MFIGILNVYQAVTIVSFFTRSRVLFFKYKRNAIAWIPVAAKPN